MELYNMSVLDTARVLVYRVHEKGLEILTEKGQDLYLLSAYNAERLQKLSWKNLIELDPVKNESGEEVKLFAVEGDYHDIPSIRGLLKNDMDLVKNKLIEKMPEIEDGVYVAIKESFKKVLPHEYAALKELKEIILHRNSLRNI